METRLWKECRALFPYWAPAIIISLGSVLLVPVNAGWVLGWGVICSVLGAMVFGHEYNHHTLSLLLSQPVSRRRIWYEKMAVLGAALCTILAMIRVVPTCLEYLYPEYMDSLVSSNETPPPECILVLLCLPVFTWLASPALTLIFKNTLATVVFAPLFPIALGVISWFLADLLAPQAIAEFSDFETVATFFVVPAGIYAAVMYLGGCYRFAGLECRESVAREWELAWLRGLRLRSRPQADDARAGFWRNAIAKELRLQKLNLMLALIFGAACLMLAGYHRLQPPGEDLMVYRIPLTLYWFIAPITLGAITFAEERQLGQFEWQLTLPPARWKLWLVKATLTLLLALLLLVGLPLAVMAWLYAPLGIAVFDTWGQTVCACGAVLLGTTLAVFISSLSATTIKAVMCTLGTLGVAALGIPPINFILRGINHGPIEDLYSAFTQYLPATTYLAVYLLLAGSIVTPFALTLGLSMRNYLAGEVRQSWAWVQWAVVVASLSFFCGLIFVLLQFLAKT